MKNPEDTESNNLTDDKDAERAWIAEANRRPDLYRKGKTATLTEEEVFSSIA